LTKPTLHPVYLSIDIDGTFCSPQEIWKVDTYKIDLVLDPSIAPATGAPESGVWTTRELKRYIEGLEGLNLVGADVVEVSPPYDSMARRPGRSFRFDYRYFGGDGDEDAFGFQDKAGASKDEL